MGWNSKGLQAGGWEACLDKQTLQVGFEGLQQRIAQG